MSIRAKLIFVFVLVVAFSGANLSVYFWSKSKSDNALEELRLATEVQGVLGEIQRGLNDLSKQNTIMGQFVSGTEDLALHPEDIERFDTQTETVSTSIAAISDSVGSKNTQQLNEFKDKYQALVKSWRRFYLFFGFCRPAFRQCQGSGGTKSTAQGTISMCERVHANVDGLREVEL